MAADYLWWDTPEQRLRAERARLIAMLRDDVKADFDAWAEGVALLTDKVEGGGELTSKERKSLLRYISAGRGVLECALSMAETSDAKAKLQQLLDMADECTKTFGDEGTS